VGGTMVPILQPVSHKAGCNIISHLDASSRFLVKVKSNVALNTTTLYNGDSEIRNKLSITCCSAALLLNFNEMSAEKNWNLDYFLLNASQYFCGYFDQKIVI
jgi:hypothetical protein